MGRVRLAYQASHRNQRAGVVKGKGKTVPLQARRGPEGSRKLRFPDFMTTAQDGGKVVSLTHRPPLTPGKSWGDSYQIVCELRLKFKKMLLFSSVFISSSSSSSSSAFSSFFFYAIKSQYRALASCIFAFYFQRVINCRAILRINSYRFPNSINRTVSVITRITGFKWLMLPSHFLLGILII